MMQRGRARGRVIDAILARGTIERSGSLSRPARRRGEDDDVVSAMMMYLVTDKSNVTLTILARDQNRAGQTAPEKGGRSE